jgi:predicted nucleic acid-binding protein
VTACVLDASIALAWLIDDEIDPISDLLMEGVVEAGAIAPAIWPTEVANGLLSASRRGRLSHQRCDDLLATLAVLDIRVEPTPLTRLQRSIFTLAARTGLSVYDASYLELALSLSLPLATLDQKLRQTAEALHVPVLPGPA